MQAKYIQLLNQRIEKGSERSLLSFGDRMIDFWSNDYLGLAQEIHSIQLSGSTGSRLISGNSARFEAIEQEMAAHFDSESALVFNSGYDANVGVFSSFPQKGDTIIYDELVHASVRDGIRLSFAKSFSFRHNDVEDLEAKLSRIEGTVFVAIESIYSMDGDLAPLSTIAQLCLAQNALLIVDEAHAGGVFGMNGKGLCEEAGIVDQVFARVFTFGKAYGAHGAVFLGSATACKFIINFARSFIYTTALPFELAAHALQQIKSIDLVNRKKLEENIAYFRSLIQSSVSDKRSPIQVLPYSDLVECKRIAQVLQENGFAAKAILPPTVPEGGQRLRICIHSFNTSEEIQRLTNFLNIKS